MHAKSATRERNGAGIIGPLSESEVNLRGEVLAIYVVAVNKRLDSESVIKS